MHIRKFESDTLDGALKNIKHELGPDAIILKTITNKGMKGVFKKKKIEITAAISEKKYSNKIKVDHVLDDDQKKKFYSNSSKTISNMIDKYAETSPLKPPNTDYSGVGINRSVKQVKQVKDDQLQKFLKEEERENEHLKESPSSIDIKNRILTLEQTVENLNKNIQKLFIDEPLGISKIRNLLSSFDVEATIIQKLIQKCILQLSNEELKNEEIVFEFILKEMISTIKIQVPSTTENCAITLFLSEETTGQTSMVQKVASRYKNSIVIRGYEKNEKCNKDDFIDKLLSIDVVNAYGIAEIITEIRKANENSRRIFVDYKIEKFNETKKFFNGIKRGFDNVDFLLSLSAIHSEVYNRKILNTYKDIVDGIVFSYIDLCMNFGSLYNIANDFNRLPFVCFGTGKIVPDDLEFATEERILSGIFNLKSSE